MARSSIHVRGGLECPRRCSVRDPEIGLFAEGQFAAHPALLSGRLAAPDFAMKCVEVRVVWWPEIWKFICVSYIMGLYGACE